MAGKNQGFLITLSYLFLVILITQNFNSKKIKNLLFIALTSATLVAIYGIFQHLGIDPLFKGSSISSKERSYSTLGNPIFLGNYLILFIPIAIVNLVNYKNYLLKILFSISTILLIVCLLFTYSRGAYLGLIAIIFLLIILFNKEIFKKNIFWFSLLLTIFLLLIFIINTQKITKGDEKINLVQRFISVKDLKEDAAAARLTIWSNTLNMIRDSPYLGFGPDTFGLIFNKYQSPKLSEFEGDFTTATNAHNIFLQITATTGFLGLFSYLWILITTCKRVFYIIKNSNKDVTIRNVIIGIFTGVIGYLISLQFSMCVVTTALILWILIGLIFTIDNKKLELKKESKSPTLRQFVIIGLCLLMFNFFSLPVSLKFFLADVHYKKAVRELENTNYDKAIYLLEKAIRANPSVGKYYLSLGYCYGEIKRWDEAEKELIKSIKLEPYYLKSYYLLGSLYENLGKFDKAIKIYKKLEEVKNVVAPSDREVYLRLANIYTQIGLKKNALAEYKKYQREDGK